MVPAAVAAIATGEADMSEHGRRLLRLHVIAKPGDQDGKLKSTGKPGEFESGRWTATDEFAEQAVGAELHLHERQGDPSWKAGAITGWRHSDLPGRVFFLLQVDPRLQITQRSDWGREQARVWES